jgi:Putative MetA-pathway of phenol degradation
MEHVADVLTFASAVRFGAPDYHQVGRGGRVAIDARTILQIRVPGLALAIAALACGSAVSANAQQASPSSSLPVADNNGQDFTRPENLFQIRNLYQTAPGNGSVPGTLRTVTTDMTIVRADGTINLTPQWTIALRGDLPFVIRNPVTTDDPAGQNISGLGDADVQAALIRQFDSRWAAGAGLRFVAPTGAEDITSGKWRMLPVAGARYSLPEWSTGSYAEALLRYDVSFAGDPSRRNVRNLQLAPMLNINLPNHWFVTLYPNTEIRINYGDPLPGQTGRLFLPVDFMVGRNVTKTVTLSLEVSVPVIKDYPVYNFRSVTRINMQF